MLLAILLMPPIQIDGLKFFSIEAYWYWLLTPLDVPRRGELRETSGYKAKELGRQISNQDWPSHNDLAFRAKICEAITIKFKTYPRIQQLLKATGTLPIVHYYYYGDISAPKVIVPSQGKWLWEHWASL